jgi:hypothetical protein
MTEETETAMRDTVAPRADGKVEVLASPHASARPTDKWSVRRAEIKKQKRRAHRRRINASNRPG